MATQTGGPTGAPTWTRGYASDITYTRGAYRELSPLWLDTALLLAGTAPPEPDGAPVWLELGCGHGLSAMMLAAARPDLHVIGVDFNPGHIAGARRLARAAGLDNLRFEEADFADMAADPAAWPLADHVAMHGVYTWVGPESREHIVRFLHRRLKPGGAAYLSYNCLPGWAPSLPVQYLLRAYGQALPGPSAAAGDAARDMLLGLLNQGAGFFAGNSAASARVERLRQAGDAYLVHEFMHEGWQPLYHAQVAGDLAAAKLTYAASAAWGENFPDLMMTPAQAALVADAPTATLAETLKDYLTAQPLRRDIYVRGPQPLEAAERLERLGRVHLTALAAPGGALPPVTLPSGPPEPEISALFPRLLTHLTDGPRPLADLIAAADDDTDTLLRAAAILVSVGVLAPALPPSPEAMAATRRLTAALHASGSPLRACALTQTAHPL